MENANSNPMLYYIGLISFIFCYMEVEVSWHYPKSVFQYISAACLFIHFLFSIRNYQGGQLFVLFFVALLTVIVGVNAQQTGLLTLSFLLVVGAKNINFESILRVHLYAGLTICLISVLGSYSGLITNKIFYLGEGSMEMLGSTTYKRYSYGYVWPTDCANHISYLVLSYWLLKKGVLKWFEICAFLCVFWFVLISPQARQAAFIILLILLTSVYFYFLRRYQKQISRKFVSFLIKSIPLFAFLSILTTIRYKETSPLWLVVNMFFNGRLKLGQDVINQYGIPWLGQYIKMIGADANATFYNYVDSSFVQMYLLWGIFLTTLLIGMFYVMCRNAASRNDLPFLFAVLFAGLSSITSQYLFQIMMCPLLLAFFSDHELLKINYIYVKERKFEETDTQFDS